ncbi:hypothetical protein DPM19_30055 [Actinomadura craniellae]|uniref:Uncharacterized protein n=1 Tax=Actinomadura craniellae TaxID=2231787 RepID=A0A365GXI1_9ACTN|nr:ATP-binding protein [Actinomadura craniellae]RAY11547.1 hypothetical protein DPM19_30055 [Actinomadura craniellae]
MHIGGQVTGTVVVGDNNVIFNHGHGSECAPRDGSPPDVRRLDRPVAQVLPRAPELVGRDAELAALAAGVDADTPVLVHGPKGVGKTALLSRFAADRAKTGTDVVFLAAAGLAVEDILQELFSSCYDITDYHPDLDRLRRLMIPIKALFVIDDFHGSADELKVLSDALPSGGLVLAAAERVPGGGRSVELSGLAEEAALALLERALERPPPGDGSARELCRAAGGLPGALLQAAAALQAGDAGSFSTDPALLARASVAGLDPDARTALDVLCALDGLAPSAELVAVLAGVPDAGGALDRLAGAHLAERSGRGHAAARGVPELVPEPADRAAALLRWVCETATPRQVAAAAPVVVRVLDTAVRRGDHAVARDLARATAPALGRGLRLGSWRQVLALGLHASQELGSVADEKYFAHEEKVRRQALGAAAGLFGGAALGTVVALGQGAGTSAGAGGWAAAHPGIIAAVATAVAAATVIAGAAALRGGNEGVPVGGTGPQALPNAAVSPAGSPTKSPPKSPGKKSPSATPSEGGRENPQPGQPCTPKTLPGASFNARAGSSAGQDHQFPWLPCDDEGAMFVRGDSAFKARRTSCPPAQSLGPCRFRVTFSPTRAGEYRATLIVPDDDGDHTVRMELRGTATGGETGGGGSQEPERPTTPPALASPPNGQIYDHYPRFTVFDWYPVAGAARYQLELERQCDPEDPWVTNFYDTTDQTRYEHEWIDGCPGRWRVIPLGADGFEGPPSGWREFDYIA